MTGHYISADQSAEEILRAIRAQAALSIACHPHHRTTRRVEIGACYLWDQRKRLASLVDAWEAANRRPDPVSQMDHGRAEATAGDSPGVTVLYFATAARLFASASGDGPITSITIERVGDSAIAVRRDDVIVPTGLAGDISLLRTVVASERAQPLAISAGRAFGVVTACPPGAAPVVSTYGAARRFLDRYVRDMAATGSTSPRTPR